MDPNDPIMIQRQQHEENLRRMQQQEQQRRLEHTENQRRLDHQQLIEDEEREELLRQVWRWDFGDLSTVTVHVKRLRAKLGEHHRIQTVWGRGYLWQGDRAAE